MAMRELLLVRKLEEEENAKKQPIGDNNSQITPQPHNDASAQLNEFPLDSSLSNSSNINQQNLLESSKPIDEELQLSPADTDHHTSTLQPDAHHQSDLNRDPFPTENDSTSVTLETTQDSTSTVIGDNTQPLEDVSCVEDVAIELSKEERQEKEAHAQALLTRRESLKDFFIKKQSYIHKDTSDTFTFSPPENISEGQEETPAKQLITDNLKKGEQFPIQKQHDASVQDTASKNSNTPMESLTTETEKSIKALSSNVNEQKSSTDTQPSTDLSPDEKRQMAAAARAAQKRGLKELIRQKKLQAAQNKSEDSIDIVVSTPEKANLHEDHVTNDNNNNNNNNGNSDPHVIKPSLKGQHQTDFSNLDIDSDSSLDWDALMAQVSDLEIAMDCEIDVDDDNEDFWKLEKIDTSELAKHLSPSSTPPSRLDFQSAISTLDSVKDDELSDTPLEVDTEEVEDIWSLANANTYDNTKEDDDFDRTLDVQLTPVLKPTTATSPALSPSPNSSLSGGKIPKLAHFGSSPLSPTSSRASSVADPDEYETMSNGSHTSVLSAGSAKSGVSTIRRPSTTFGIRPPSRVNYSSITSKIASPQIKHPTSPTPGRPRSLSGISNSSAEESTTSSVGATTPSRIASPTRMLRMSPMHQTFNSGISPPGPRQRSLSSVSNSSTDERMAKPSNSAVRLSRIGYGTTKSSGIRSASPARVRSIAQGGTSPNTVASKLNNTQTRSTQLQRSTSVASGLARPSSRVGTTNTKTFVAGAPARGQGLAPLSETAPKAPLLNKKARSQSISNKSGTTTNPSGIVSPTGLTRVGTRSPTILRKSGDSSINYSGGRQSSDSLSSHEDYSAVNSVFTPPESPTNASSETDSLTSLTSSVSYGSSPGRGTSPIPPRPASSLMATPNRLVPPTTRSPSVASKLPPPSRLAAPGKYASGPLKSSTGLRKSNKKD